MHNIFCIDKSALLIFSQQQIDLSSIEWFDIDEIADSLDLEDEELYEVNQISTILETFAIRQSTISSK